MNAAAMAPASRRSGPPGRPRRPGRHRASRGLVMVSGLLVAAFVVAGPAQAYWRSSGSGNGTAATGTLASPTGVTVPSNSASTVPVSWTASTGSPVPTGYYVTRTVGGSTVAACGTSPTALVSATSCSDTAVAPGAYIYRVIAVYRSWTATSTDSGTVTVGAATKVVFTAQPTNASAGTAITPPVSVTVQTAAGIAVPVSGTAVTLAIATNPGGGALSGTLTILTNTSGVATFTNVSINNAGAGYTLTAASSGVTSATSSTFTITAAAASKFVITSNPVAGVASASANLGPITVQAQDTFGNPVTAGPGGLTVTLASNSTGTRIFSPALNGAAITTIAIPSGSSTATFYYGDTKAATPTITASGGLTSDTQTETVTAAAATQLAFGQQPTNTARGATITPAVRATILDTFGNQTTSTASVTIAIGNNAGLLGLGVLGGTLTRAAVAGVATFNNLSIDGVVPGVGATGTGYTLKVTATGLTLATSSPFNIT